MNMQTIKRITLVLLAAFLFILSGNVAEAKSEDPAFVPASHFITPTDGTLVTGIIGVELYVHQSAGQRVTLEIDGKVWQRMSYMGRGRYITHVDTNYLKLGEHTLSARFDNTLSSSRLLAPPPVEIIVVDTDPPTKEADSSSDNFEPAINPPIHQPGGPGCEDC